MENKSKVWVEKCSACGKSHRVTVKKCPSCGIYAVITAVSERISANCHWNVKCDGCKEYETHEAI